jgi:hypothetical protein
MTDPFARPSNDFWSAKDYEGKLHLFENIGAAPYECSTSSNKPGETSTAIDADVTVIDADGGAKVFPKCRVFGQAVVGTLSRVKPGTPLLGRIVKGQASLGKNPPWLLQDYTDAEATLAGQYLTQRATGSFQQPAAPATPAPAATSQQSAVNLDDPAVQAALAALAAQGVAAGQQSSEVPF